jgi:aminopeptidase N
MTTRSKQAASVMFAGIAAVTAALAEYLVYAYEEEGGLTDDAATMRRLWRRIGRGAPYPIRPLASPAVDLSTWTYGGYGAGPMALFVQLEPWLDRATLIEALRRFLDPSAARSVDDLRLALEAASGLDLRRYFDAWVFGTGEPVWPAFEVTTAPSGAETIVTVTQMEQGTVVFPCVVEVEVRGATEVRRASVDFGLAPSGASATARVTLDEPVASVRVDPDARLLGWAMAGVAADPPPPTVRWHP